MRLRVLSCAFIAATFVFCAVARGGLVDVSPLAALRADASAQLSGGDNGATDQKQSHDTGGASKSAAAALADASVPFGGTTAHASAVANVAFDVTDAGVTLSGLACASVPGSSPASSANAESVLDLPFTIHNGIGRLDFSIDVSSSSITGDEVAVSLDRVDPVDAGIVFQHTFTQSYSKHFVDRLEAGAYRLTVDAKASADSPDAGGASELDSVSYQLAIAPSDVPGGAIPLPAGVWFGAIGLIAVLLVGRRRFLGWIVS